MSDQALDSQLQFDHSFVDNLTGFYVKCSAAKAPSAKIVQLNQSMADQLGLDTHRLSARQLAGMLTGTIAVKGAKPVAQAYAGHQFGQFNPQLGDGRALLFGEVIDVHGQRLDIHLKGSGRTAFSRTGDGKAVLGAVLREYLMAEAMHSLKIPTTRALGAFTTGEQIMRDRLLPGAVFARVAKSHIRVGTFQFFAARNELKNVEKLADYCIERHYPELREHRNPYLALLEKVCDQQAALVAKWMSVGFVHGVMNTDNFTISAETIDYGPCAFLDSYHSEQVFSSIDHSGRYAFSNQPNMAKWNSVRFAETLLGLIDADEAQAIASATQVISSFDQRYQDYRLKQMRAKLGLQSEKAEDLALINQLLVVMEDAELDYTLTFRALATSLCQDISTLRELAKHLSDQAFEPIHNWHVSWLQRLSQESIELSAIARAMDRHNPLYIPRNHLVENALNAAQDEQDLSHFERLLAVLENPYQEQAKWAEFAKPAPQSFGRYTTYCGT